MSTHISHHSRVMDDLRHVGISRIGLSRMNARYLPTIIRASEHIMGAADGYCDSSYVMLIATDQRVIYLSKKPFFIHQDDISYDVISGVSFSHAGLGSTVTLHTRIRDYTIHTLNRGAVATFIHFIEQRCLAQEERRHFND